MTATRRHGMPSPLPLSGRWLATLVIAFLLPGLIGHDPWKSEDAISFGVVYGLLDHGTWLTPSLAGEPWLRDGPLYYWMAALCAKALHMLVPVHDGARVASLVSIAAALYFTRMCGRELYGKRAGDLACLTLLGCGGLVLQSRACAPETLALAAVAAFCHGVAIAWKKPVKGGIVLGIGLAVAFLASGVHAVLPPLIALLALLPFARLRRSQAFLRAACTGLGIALVLSLPWLVALALVAPDYLHDWVQAQSAVATAMPQASPTLDHLRTIAWATWPAWPLALWVTWNNRRQLNDIGGMVPLAIALVSIVLLVLNPAPRPIDLLTLLAPLSIPAGLAALQLRRGAANALAWFSAMTFSLLIGLLWVVWIATSTGVPADLASAATRLEPGYAHAVSPMAALLALVATGIWIGLLRRTRQTPLREIPLWTGAVTITAAVVLLLGVGWIDYGKSYRLVAESLRDHLPAQTRCIDALGLGEVQRAMFHYHGGFVTRARSAQALATETAEADDMTCNALLIQRYADDPEIELAPSWRITWEASRPRDRERFRLYSR